MAARAVRALLVVLIAAACGNADRRAEPDRVVLIVFDTLRADRLGCYGNPAPVSPTIDALAASGARFDSAVSLSSWTKPSVATLFTSISPADHDVGYAESVLPADAVTLAETLRDAGFETVGFSANMSVSDKTGFEQGFDRFRNRGNEWGQASPSPEIYRRVLRRAEKGKRQFFYLHLMGPHGPYVPPPAARSKILAFSNPAVDRRQRGEPSGWYRYDSPEELEYLRALYDAEILAEDTDLGHFVDALRERGLLESTLLVVASDHGEAFGEHGQMEHGAYLFREETHVPLIFHGPGVAAGVRREVVGLHDVAPTILGRVGVAPPASFQGVDLFGPVPRDRLVRMREFTEEEGDDEWRGAIRGDAKALWIASGAKRLYFDSWRDDSDDRDRSAERHAALEQIEDRYDEESAPRLRAARTELDEEMREGLRALGYLE